jgi:putative spermidine/putrescine transport system substrate-binding protein
MRLASLAVSLLALVGSVVAVPDARAQQTLYVAGYGGFFEQTIRKEIIPVFEQTHNVKVAYITGNSADTMAKLQAQKGNQQIDIAIADDGPMYQAIELGFCGPIKGLPIHDLQPAARFPEDKAVGIGLVGTGIVYNTKYFAEKGWKAPTSWRDLADPKFRQLLLVPPANNTYGLHTLVMMARIQGGGEKNIEPGFKMMKEKINPNVLAYEPSQGKVTELFQSGQAVIAVWGSGPMKTFMDTGFPVDFVYPAEGAPLLRVAVCPIAKANQSPLAHEWIKAMLTPEFQLTLARQYGYGPVNKKANVTEADAKVAPIGSRAAKLLAIDWNTINVHREEWTNRWNRDIER